MPGIQDPELDETHAYVFCPGRLVALPKGIDITSHQPYLDAIADELNDRPRAVLGFLTPREAFTKLLNDNVALTG